MDEMPITEQQAEAVSSVVPPPPLVATDLITPVLPRPGIVTTTAILLFIYAAAVVYRGINAVVTLINYVSPVPLWWQVTSLPIIAILIYWNISMGIGLLKLRPRARVGTIILLCSAFVFGVVDISFTLHFTLQSYITERESSGHSFTHIIMLIIIICYFLARTAIYTTIIVWLTRPSITAAFKRNA